MPESLPAPDAEYLQSLAAELNDLYLDDDRQLDDARNQREMRIPAMAGTDPRYKIVDVDPRDPDVTEEAFQQTAIMTMERPKLQLKAGEGDTAQTNASLREHWTEEVLWECGTREPGQDTMSQCTDSALNDGGAWSKILFAPDAWDQRYKLDKPGPSDKLDAYTSYDKATEEAKRNAGPPFVWMYVDPRCIYPVFSGGRLCEVMEITDRPQRSTMRRYRLGRDHNGDLVPEELGRPQAENNPRTLPYSITMYEHWDERWCFPAETLVESDSDLAGGYKRWYEGQLATIRTARGYQLSGTPNHPVMTERGWVPLGELKQGDRVISRTFRERATPRDPDPQDRQLPIGQVFGLLKGLGVGMRRMGAVQDFHGDGQEREIDVVRTARVLWDRVHATLTQPRQQLPLATTHEREGARVGLGLLDQRGGAAGPAAQSEVGSHGLGLALLGRLATVAQPSSVLSPAHGDTEPFQSTADRASVDAEIATDLDGRLLEFDVSADEVVHVENVFFAGYVYNLETSKSTYSANGIIVHNCTWAVGGTNYHGSPTGIIVKQFEHGYPFGVPYDFGPGLWMSYWRNRKVGWGISQTKLWLVQYRQYLRAMHAQYVARDLLSPLQSFGDSSAAPIIGNDGKPREREPGPLPGEIINNGPGRQLAKIDYANADTLEKHMSLIDQAIAQLESPKVTTLGGMEGAGFAISQVLSYSRTRVAPVSNGLATLLKGQTEKLWDLARYKVKERIYVGYSAGDGQENLGKGGYIGLDPSDFERPVRIRWEVQQQLPTDDMMRARYAHERLAAGTWGSDEAVEYLGDNPDEIRRSKERDRIRQTPQYQKWLDSQVFMFAGRGDILQLAQQASDLANNGVLADQMQANQPGLPGAPSGQGAPAPGVFEGANGVPDMAALAAAPNGAGVNPPPGPAVMAAAGGATGVPAGGLPPAQQSIRY